MAGMKDEEYEEVIAYLAELAAAKKATPAYQERERNYEAFLESQRVAFEDACSHNPDLCLRLVRHPLPSHYVSSVGIDRCNVMIERYININIEALTPAGHGQATEKCLKELQLLFNDSSSCFHVIKFFEYESFSDPRSDGETYYYVSIGLGRLDMSKRPENEN
jgi:hypothetical protein